MPCHAMPNLENTSDRRRNACHFLHSPVQSSSKHPFYRCKRALFPPKCTSAVSYASNSPAPKALFVPLFIIIHLNKHHSFFTLTGCRALVWTGIPLLRAHVLLVSQRLISYQPSKKQWHQKLQSKPSVNHRKQQYNMQHNEALTHSLQALPHPPRSTQSRE